MDSAVAWVFLGSGAGGVARYLLSTWLNRALPSPFPVGTFAVNVSGSFLITLLMEAGLRGDALPAAARLALVTGVLGGFTTYSSFTYETWALLQRDAWLSAVANVAGTTVCGLLAGGAGMWAAGRLTSG